MAISAEVQTFLLPIVAGSCYYDVNIFIPVREVSAYFTTVADI